MAEEQILASVDLHVLLNDVLRGGRPVPAEPNLLHENTTDVDFLQMTLGVSVHITTKRHCC